MELVEGVARVDDLDAFVARLSEIGDEQGATIQAFDARYVVDRAHLARAVELADRAIEREENVARDRAMEILCYAAGRRQIERALEMGVSEGECPAVILVTEDGDDDAEIGEDSTPDEAAAAATVRGLLEPEPTLGEYDPDRVSAFFDVGEAELAAADGALPDLVRERVALLDVEK